MDPDFYVKLGRYTKLMKNQHDWQKLKKETLLLLPLTEYEKSHHHVDYVNDQLALLKPLADALIKEKRRIDQRTPNISPFNSPLISPR